MTQDKWTAVDDYFTGLLSPNDEALDAAIAAADEAKMLPMHVALNQGQLIALLAQSVGAKAILEIGTLAGYSTIWLARTGGKVITLEIDPTYAEIARTNVARAGLADTVEVRVGSALDSLPALADEGHVFDFVFIDADKQNSKTYFEWALKMTRPGSLIVVDNVVRDGKVVDPSSDDERVQGTRRVLEAIASEPRVKATAIQTVGSKGYDGFALALVLE